MSDLEKNMKKNLYRVLCPDPQVLGEYHLNFLPADQRSEVQIHLIGCHLCQRELAELATYMNSVKPDLDSVTLASRLRVIFARLLSPGSDRDSNGQLNLVPVAVRGDEDAPVIYDAEEWQIAIEIEDDVEQPGTKVMIGLVIGDLNTKWQAHLWQDEREIATTTVDSVGNFRFSKLQPASYVLILSAADLEIYIQSFEIGIS